ncbi:MAG: chorismate synthase, partial [Lachnospiraceae bacterium]|nr:chorismate synthase [Lachnospiraceae bacterium]
TPRKEDDCVEILSGVFEGKTTGTPISMVVFNKTQRSQDYDHIKNIYRPGHADFCFDAKYGFRDYRGGGRSSGRETIGRVAAGAVAIKILKQLGIEVTAYSKAIGGVEIDYDRFDKDEIANNPLYMPDKEASDKAQEYLKQMMSEKNSVGGIIECVVDGMPAGIGEPVFDKLDANLAKAVMSIGAVKGVEIGDGFDVAGSTGLSDNDGFEYKKDTDSYVKTSNHAGGILGGISDGSQIVLRAAIKPTPSIASTQNTATSDKENVEIEIHGRHDPIIVPRAVVVVESMVALTIVDLIFTSMTSRMDNIVRFFE